ncbi:MAG: pilin [Candidatus Falkowbacteria bacterium]
MKLFSKISKVTVIAVLLFLVFTIFVNVGLAQQDTLELCKTLINTKEGLGSEKWAIWNEMQRCQKCGDCSLDDFVRLAVNVSNWILGIVGSLALLFFVYGGFMMIISAGNTERSGKAKTILTNAIIGLVIVFTSWLIIYFVQTTLGAKQRLDNTPTPIETGGE